MKNIINSLFSWFGFKLIKKSNDSGYISAKETVKNAKKEGLSVCAYVEKLWDQVGETEKVINNMENFGIFKIANPVICEIGAGTGRYLEMVHDRCKPKRYESYETASDWAIWLQKTYPIIALPTDGFTLKSTEDNSIDILHAHGVFVYIPFFDSLRYFKEIDRVTKKNSFIVFDCVTDDCLQNGLLEKWVSSKYNYPRLLPEKYIIQFFPKSKYELLGTFFTKYGKGKSKYFVFRKIK